MSTSPLCPARSERGVALIIVLLLLAVMSAMATGMAVNSQVEVAMTVNEAAYAGARAAAEAGMNRAIEAITDPANNGNDLLAGADGAVDLVTPGAAVNADNGDIAFLLAGASPYALGASGRYAYTIDLLDDDDPSLFTTALDPTQLASMVEDGQAFNNVNQLLILRTTGTGPSGTVVTVSRVIRSAPSVTPGPVPPPIITNPAILVDGSLTISGNPSITGANGSVHANGNLTVSGGSVTVEENATASGAFSANAGWSAGGSQGGGAPTVEVPTINAADYFQYATHALTATGEVRSVVNGVIGGIVASGGWSWTAGAGWSISGNNAPVGTFYATGDVSVSGNRGSNGNPLMFSVIATGSITVTGNSTIKPQNAAALQFVTNKDLVLAGNLDADYSTVEGQSLVQEQLTISGNPDLRGQIIVKNGTNSAGSPSSSNTISGNPGFIYDGGFAGIVSAGIIPPAVTTFTNNVFGWIEQ